MRQPHWNGGAAVDFVHISSAAQLRSLKHPHFGKIQTLGFFKSNFGILTGITRKAVTIVDYSSGTSQTVALHVNPSNFLVTINNSFVLVSLQEGSTRPPVILKRWKLVEQQKGKGVTAFIGSVSTYLDSDGLKWEHRFN